MKKEPFIFQREWAEQLLAMPEAMRYPTIDAILRYAVNCTEPTDPTVKFGIFSLIRLKIDEDAERYREKCDRNKANAGMRWHATACDGMRPHNLASNNNSNNNSNNKDNTSFYITKKGEKNDKQKKWKSCEPSKCSYIKRKIKELTE